MYLLGYSLDNLSLMALTISTGFVVDDAIVVIKNITRHIETGMPQSQAVLQGTREVAFTVLAMSLSLVGVCLPVLLMGGLDGRLFREFAVTLSVAITISLVFSLTTTPMMCARLLARQPEDEHGRLYRIASAPFTLYWTATTGRCSGRCGGPVSSASLRRFVSPPASSSPFRGLPARAG
jgi:multidrug efflux pump